MALLVQRMSPDGPSGPETLRVLYSLQVGPGLVFVIITHAFLGHGSILQTEPPLEPLLQNVVHKIYYQKNVPAIIPKFILRAECIQVRL